MELKLTDTATYQHYSNQEKPPKKNDYVNYSTTTKHGSA